MLYPLPAALITVSDPKLGDNVFTAAWVGTVCTNPPMLSVSVRPERYSYPIMEKTGVFAVNLTTEKLAYATDYCGVVSGRDVDKFQRAGLTKIPAETIAVPLIDESPVNIECRVVEKKILGSHTMFLAEVLCVHAAEDYFDDSGRFCLEKANPIVYSHGSYFGLGKKLGKFGYSVSGKKKGPRKKSSYRKDKK